MVLIEKINNNYVNESGFNGAKSPLLLQPQDILAKDFFDKCQQYN